MGLPEVKYADPERLVDLVPAIPYHAPLPTNTKVYAFRIDNGSRISFEAFLGTNLQGSNLSEILRSISLDRNFGRTDKTLIAEFRQPNTMSNFYQGPVDIEKHRRLLLGVLQPHPSQEVYSEGLGTFYDYEGTLDHLINHSGESPSDFKKLIFNSEVSTIYEQAIKYLGISLRRDNQGRLVMGNKNRIVEELKGANVLRDFLLGRQREPGRPAWPPALSDKNLDRLVHFHGLANLGGLVEKSPDGPILHYGYPQTEDIEDPESQKPMRIEKADGFYDIRFRENTNPFSIKTEVEKFYPKYSVTPMLRWTASEAGRTWNLGFLSNCDIDLLSADFKKAFEPLLQYQPGSLRFNPLMGLVCLVYLFPELAQGWNPKLVNGSITKSLTPAFMLVGAALNQKQLTNNLLVEKIEGLKFKTY